MISSAAAAPVVLSYGGEIYNYREIRQLLKAHGHRFVSESDTEVVLRAYLEWGRNCVQQFRGMFAFALWDASRKLLLLARDPLGIKPLFYMETPDGVIFSSEPKGLFSNPLTDCRVDKCGLAELLGLWPYKSPGHGIYEGIHEVRPGEILAFEGGQKHQRRYWQLTAMEHREDLPATADRLRELVITAVTSQLGADVPVSFLLSGGIDSSGLLAIAVAAWRNDYDVETFSMDFVDAAATFTPSAFRPDRDAPYVTSMSDLLRVKNNVVILSTEEIHDAESAALTARDLPDTGDMDASLLLLFRRIGGSFRVCLTGEGADELFGGYPWFVDSLMSPLTTFPWRQYLSFPAEFINPDIARAIQLEEYVSDQFATAVAEVPRLAGEAVADRHARTMAYLDLTRFLPGQLERKDRASMASGVEARVPYCDQSLVEYAWNIPGSIKAQHGIEKAVLREAFRGLLPDRVRLRRKASYPTLMNPAHEDHMRSCIYDVMLDKSWPLHDLIDTTRLAGVLRGEIPPPTSRASVWMGRIWSLYRWWDAYRPELAW